MSRQLNRVWWLVVPLALLAVQIVLEITLSSQTLAVMLSESGPHEMLQFVIIFAAFGVAAWTVFRMDRRANKPLAAWLGLAAVCCFYVAFEEISWGQHILEWDTPDYWTQVNDQQETNLHNTTSWLDQKPRLALELGILVGGLIIPLLMRFRPAALPQRFAVIYPPPYLFIIAVLLVVLVIADKTGEAFGLRMFERVSEIEELYMFYFVLLYLLEMKNRALGPASP